MSDQAPTIIEILLTAVISLFGYLGKKHLDRVRHLERIAATKDDLAQVERRFDERMKDLARERRDRDRLVDRKLDEGFRGVHGRLDRLYHWRSE